MRSLASLLLLFAFGFTGCTTARHVAESSFRVIDAPANYIRRHIDDERTTTTTTVTQSSDVVTPGHAVTGPPPPPPTVATTQRHSFARTQEVDASAENANRTARTSTTPPQRKPAPSPSTRAASPQTVQFPTAKPVPGKPGYVYSIDPKGGIVDVTGYKSGDKAKDPYTQQIFIVP
jgi:hypothetical protein